jgi:hypothetical protein
VGFELGQPGFNYSAASLRCHSKSRGEEPKLIKKDVYTKRGVVRRAS